MLTMDTKDKNPAFAAAIDKAPAAITGRQLRAARALAEMSRADLAEHAGVSQVTIDAHEQKGGQPITAQLETKLRLVEALFRNGVRLGDDERIERVK